MPSPNQLLTLLIATFLALPAAACPTHSVTLPNAAGTGPGKEVKELLDTPFVKLVSITLRGGTVLTEHAAPVAVTIQALTGTGTLRIGDKKERLAPGLVVLVAPNALHDVTPDGKGDLVLLVHFLKSAPGAAAPGHDHEQGKDHAH